MHPLHLRQMKGLKKYDFGFEGYISKAEEGAGFSEGQGGGGGDKIIPRYILGGGGGGLKG